MDGQHVASVFYTPTEEVGRFGRRDCPRGRGIAQHGARPPGGGRSHTPQASPAPCSCSGLQRTRTPLATSGRFRRPNRLETPPNAGVSPGRRSRRRTTPAENRTEVQDSWRNRRPFPAKPPKSRGGATAGKGATAVSSNAGATDASAPPDIAANAPPPPVQKRFDRRQRP